MKKKTKKPETAGQRAQRHIKALDAALPKRLKYPDLSADQAIEVGDVRRIAVAVAKAVVPGTQKRRAGYAIALEEVAVRTAARILRKL